jgi:hypothetical protein
VVNVMSQYGLFDWAISVVNGMLSGQQGPHNITDLSFKIMDTYQYDANCYKARSLEVAFNADDTTYLDFLNLDVFDIIDQFAQQNVLYGGYISLRYCAGSSALLAIEQFPRTVCIELSALSGLSSEFQILDAFEQAAARRGAAIHWGQLNNRTTFDIDRVYGQKINTWRKVLVRTSRAGNISTFDNDFCRQRGLEPLTARPIQADLSYLVPLLLSD